MDESLTVRDDASDDHLSEGYQAVLGPLSDLVDALGRQREALSAGSWQPGADEIAPLVEQLAGYATAALQAVVALQQAQHAERRRLVHDIRGPLNAIAAWAYLLRLEENASDKILQAADVLDRNVRMLTKVIESA